MSASGSSPLSGSPNPRKRAHPDSENSVAEAGAQIGADSDGLKTFPVDGAGESESPNFIAKKARIEEDEETRSRRQFSAEPKDIMMEDSKSVLSESEERATISPAAAAAVSNSEKLAIPSRKKKLTFLEKQIQDAEKKAKKDEEKRLKEEEKRMKEEERRRKEEEKAEEKRKKEEEKRMKDEEKKRKEEEKAEEKRKKDEEREEKKRLKEEERQKKEDEKMKKVDSKKDKGQMSLNAFIAISNTTKHPAAVSKEGTPDNDATPALTGSASKPSSMSDYERTFVPFFVKPHVAMAPQHRWIRDEEGLNLVRKKLDEYLDGAPELGAGPRFIPFNIFELCHIPSRRRSARGVRLQYTVKEIMAHIRESEKSAGSAEYPVDITDTSNEDNMSTISKWIRLLQSVPMKHLQFYEDERPPYRGTYTKQPSPKIIRSLCRNPTQRKLPNVNYDYDSEAAWDPEEEGEDLDSDGEQEEADDEDAEDMEGFLDDEDAEVAGSANRRRAVLSDLVPVCSGLCWDDGENMNAELDTCRMEILLHSANLPIDPFSTSYWEPVKSLSVSDCEPSANGSTQKTILSAMNPPRLPLNAIKGANMAVNVGSNKLSVGGSGKDAMVAAGDLAKFKAAVQGSDLTKTGLIEVLKKKFPDNSKTAIKNTLTTIAERVGTKEADKRWKLIDGA